MIRRGWSWDDLPSPRPKDDHGAVSWLLLMGAAAVFAAGLGAASGWVPAQLDGRWLAMAVLVAIGWFLASLFDTPSYADLDAETAADTWAGEGR